MPSACPADDPLGTVTATLDSLVADFDAAYPAQQAPTAPMQGVLIATGGVVFSPGKLPSAQRPGWVHAAHRDHDNRVTAAALVNAAGEVRRLNRTRDEDELRQILQPAIDQLDPDLFLAVDQYRADQAEYTSRTALREHLASLRAELAAHHRTSLNRAAAHASTPEARTLAHAIAGNESFTGSEASLLVAATAATR